MSVLNPRKIKLVEFAIMHTPKISIIMFAVAAFLGALGQYFYKSGAEKANGGFASYLLNWRLASGVICYLAVMTFFVAAFKKGGALTVLYPIYASTFIWAAVIAWLAYGTPIKAVNIAGMGLLIAGMGLMGK